MLSLFNKFLSSEYLKLLMRSKMPFLRGEVVKIHGYRIRYPDWDHFYGLCYEIFIEKIYDISGVNECRLIVDAGANIGLSTIYFNSRYKEAKILCFEPNPEASRYLKKNIKENNIDATVFETALGLEDGEVSFYIDENTEGATSAGVYDFLSAKKRSTREIVVQKARLSTFINEKVDILKLDIEGSEWEVMEDLIKTGKIEMINSLLIELHYHPVVLEKTLGEFLSLLTANGYFYYVSRRNNENEGKKRAHSYYIFAFREDSNNL